MYKIVNRFTVKDFKEKFVMVKMTAPKCSMYKMSVYIVVRGLLRITVLKQSVF